MPSLDKNIRCVIIHKCDMAFDGGNYAWGTALCNEFYYDKIKDNIIGSNGEYSLIVNYCPLCGIKLRDLLNK